MFVARSITRKFWFQRHPQLALCTLTVLASVTALILAELAARVLIPEWAPVTQERIRFWKYDELLGWAHKPRHRGRFNHPEFSVEVLINSHGMRDSEYSVGRTEKRRMLVIGDSYGWGFGVEHGERFSELLEDAHPEWEIINASVSGYGTDQEFLCLRERALAFKPDLVLLLFCYNDFVNNRRAVDYWYFKPYFVVEGGRLRLCNVPVPQATAKQRLQRLLLGSTYLGPRLYSGAYSFAHLIGAMVDRRAKSQQDWQGTDVVTEHLVAAMAELCEMHGGSFVLVATPMNVERADLLRRIAEKEKIPYLQLDAAFESAVSDVRFRHDEHWNTKGHEIAAKAIERFLSELGVW